MMFGSRIVRMSLGYSRFVGLGCTLIARPFVDRVCQEGLIRLANSTDSPFCKQAETVLLPELSSPSNRRVIFLHKRKL